MKMKPTFKIFLAAAILFAVSCHKDDESTSDDDLQEETQFINNKPEDEEPVIQNNRQVLAGIMEGVSENAKFLIEQGTRNADWLNGEYYTCSFSYPSTTADGQPVWLTGRMAWPKEGEAKNIIVGCHSTITDNISCPSMSLEPLSDCGILSTIFAPNALVVCPDYEGFGSTSDRPQAYLSQEATARQVVDAVIAAKKELVGRHKCELAYGSKMVVVGYSQGGAVAMAVQKYLEQGFSGGKPMADDLKFMGSVCGAGPYDPLTTLKHYVNNDRVFLPAVMPLIVNGFCENNRLLKGTYKPEDFFNADFLNSGILNWFRDKAMTTTEILQGLCDYSIDHTKGISDYQVPSGEPRFSMYAQVDLRPDAVVSRTDGYIEMNAENEQYYIWRTTPGSRYAPASLTLKKSFIDFLKDKPAASDAEPTLVSVVESNNLLTGWKPLHPFVVFHSKHDEVVPFVNYENAKASFGSSEMFHGVVYDTRTAQRHIEVGHVFFAVYLENYVYPILSNKPYELEHEVILDGMF